MARIPDDIQRSGPSTGSGDSANDDGGTESEQSDPDTTSGGDRPDPTPTAPADPGPGAGDSPEGGGDTDTLDSGEGGSGGGDGGGRSSGSSGSGDSGSGQRPDPTPSAPAQSGPGAGDSPEGGDADTDSESAGDGGRPDPTPTDPAQRQPGAGASDEPGSAEAAQRDRRAEQWVEQNYQRGPTGASERISGERGLADEGSPNDPLEGQGMERGFGAAADTARDFEDRVVRNNPNLEEGDVRVDFEGDTLVIERAGAPVPREQPSEPPSGVGQLDRGDRTDAQIDQDIAEQRRLAEAQQSNLTRGAGTEAQNQRAAIRQQVRQSLEAQGFDADAFEVEVSREDGQVEASAERQEQFGDWVVAVPSAQEAEGPGEQAVENAVGTVFSPAGAATDDLVEATGTLTGTAGTRLETVLDAGGERIRQGISATSEEGGDVVEDALVSGILGPTFGRQTSSDLADLGIEFADEQTGVDVDQQVDSYTEGVYSGGAAIGNVFDTVSTGKEATEFVGYSAQEVAAGDTGELASDVTERGAGIAARAVSQAQANPTATVGRLAGGLTVSTVSMGAAGAVSSRAGTAARYAIQPGEELATGAVRSGLRSTRIGGSSSDVVSSARSAINRAKLETARIRADTRGQGRLTGGVGRSRRTGESDGDGIGSSEDVDLMDRQSADELRQDETARLARQAQQQAEYEVEQQYGDRVRDTLPEVDDTVTRQTRAADDIQPGAQRGGDPQVASGEDISFSENFQRSIRETRRESYFQEADFNQRLSRSRGSAVSGRYQQPELDATPRQDLRRVEQSRTTDAELEAESLLDDALRGVRSTEADAVQEPRVDEDVFSVERTDKAATADTPNEFRQDTDARADVSERQQLELDQRAETETQVENVFETETRTDARQEVETEIETEPRTESRSDFRFDSRGESRRESEFDLSGDNSMDDVLFGGEPDGDEQRFEYRARDL